MKASLRFRFLMKEKMESFVLSISAWSPILMCQRKSSLILEFWDYLWDSDGMERSIHYLSYW